MTQRIILALPVLLTMWLTLLPGKSRICVLSWCLDGPWLWRMLHDFQGQMKPDKCSAWLLWNTFRSWPWNSYKETQFSSCRDILSRGHLYFSQSTTWLKSPPKPVSAMDTLSADVIQATIPHNLTRALMPSQADTSLPCCGPKLLEHKLMLTKFWFISLRF